MNRKELGAELKRIRSETGMSQVEFAEERLGKSQSYAAKVETGTVGADVEEIEAWAQACGYDFFCEFRKNEISPLPSSDQARVEDIARALSVATGPLLTALRAQLDAWGSSILRSSDTDDSVTAEPRPERREAPSPRMAMIPGHQSTARPRRT